MVSHHIGLFFGTFNPVHTGHMVIAHFLVEETDLDEVWMVISPQNPFKVRQSMLSEYDRLHLVELAIGDHPRLRSSNVEFGLPKPSYTVQTLGHLREQYPMHTFSLIMGGDNLASFHKWRNHEDILHHHRIFVYRREGSEKSPYADHEKVTVLDVPLLNISSSMIRNMIAEGKEVRYLIPDAARKYIDEMGWYRE